ncbi:hypothetical protein N7456_002326 [Penicillium angulare]|uniref:Tat pathway signal sequence n=1 Tax=Penicillium angulare TaxID=116970 RepID=A0A9W9KQ38_9EURO|nr:hypothetical protein N7456_002326 [Penicillium angulare]
MIWPLFRRDRDEPQSDSKRGLLAEYPHDSCHQCESYQRLRLLAVVFQILSAALSILCIGLAVAFASSRNRVLAGYWNPTDLKTVQNEIPAVPKQIRFSAGLRYNESHELVRTGSSGRKEYVGDPSPELESAWEEIMGAVNIFITAEEERGLGEDLYMDPATNLYMAEPTVFHDLHCLNMIRKNLYYYWDYYPHNNRSILKPHLDHCIDSIRQSIMCTGDMTMAPIIWDFNKGRFIPDFEVHHTCRDYDALKEWTLLRDSEHEERWRDSAARLHAMGH